MTYLFLAVSLATYVGSLVLVPFGSWPGWADLAFGWLGIGAVPSSLCWLANPILWFSWAAVGSRMSRRVSVTASAVALACAGSFLFMSTALAGEGPPEPIGPLGIGYWLWLFSMAAACASALSSKPARAREPTAKDA